MAGAQSTPDLQVPVPGRSAVLIPAAELRWRFSRSSGPGGQNVNTTDSRVELVFDLAASPSLSPALRARALRRLEARLVEGCVVIAASEHRSQWQNRVAAQRRLAALLEEALKRRHISLARSRRSARTARRSSRSAPHGLR